MDGIFYWTGKGLNWDVYGHNPASPMRDAKLPCSPDANGYNTVAPNGDQLLRVVPGPQQAAGSAPFGDVAAGGPITLPDPNILDERCMVWRQRLSRAERDCTRSRPDRHHAPVRHHRQLPRDEAGFAFMWHSHNEREITTNNIFPGGMMMMMCSSIPGNS